MAAERHQVGTYRCHVERQPSDVLRGVAMEQDACRPCPLCHLGNRVQNTGLAVGRHDRHHQHIGLQQLVKRVKVDESTRRHPDHVHLR